MSRPDILLLDNLDSFVYNLLDEFASAGMNVEVYRNNVPAADLLARLARRPGVLVLSPGPGHPQDAGELMPLLRAALGRHPVLGICLGFQALIEASGGAVGRVGPVHGEAQTLTLTGSEGHPLFAGLGPLSVARYHSLGSRDLPPTLHSLAEIDGISMAAEHRQHAALGFQFHPESLLTPRGRELLLRSAEFLTGRHIGQPTFAATVQETTQ
ncbi:glutamine amidotransferase-related protein [Deinococcus radiophilus]|uniref:anthranilate synthase n=2 Tax=Deinococcus radiophilus TaxID=32062 RepID=A0A3S0I4R6_9DEIO|nr:gamma-glutamyl-gamma-aminobutyrate hydrolase family protein [Deinococcus radiophilus]RTR24701.1 aminodeoxychorismate/anthranilate synthase component II [Deinococcus radiophilus]UFA51629.1 gamma-glutamyl-gamma-aminobutyrate hydrolase family protein [Deinococcus radiophilus]